MLVWLHGGGHVVGSLDSYDAIAAGSRCEAIASSCRSTTASRRSTSFPPASTIALPRSRGSRSHAAEIRRRSARLAIGGDSAGGNLAAVCAILARDAGAPALRFQLLVYPRTAPDEELPSHHEFAEGLPAHAQDDPVVSRPLSASDADRNDFRYAPLICKDLSRLPPALVIVGECDPLRDDGIAYAEGLRRRERVELSDYPGMVHPFFSMGGAVDAGRRAMTQAAGTLKRAFSGS